VSIATCFEKHGRKIRVEVRLNEAESQVGLVA
jgi:hypothetical protein